MAKKQIVDSKPAVLTAVLPAETSRDKDFIPLSSLTFVPGPDGGGDIGVWNLCGIWGFEFED